MSPCSRSVSDKTRVVESTVHVMLPRFNLIRDASEPNAASLLLLPVDHPGAQSQHSRRERSQPTRRGTLLEADRGPRDLPPALAGLPPRAASFLPLLRPLEPRGGGGSGRRSGVTHLSTPPFSSRPAPASPIRRGSDVSAGGT